MVRRRDRCGLCLTTLYGNDRINRICHRCGRFLLYNCGCDGIGRHARFRFLCREACRFKSCHPHQTPERRFRGFLRMETLNPGIQGLRCRSGRCKADVHWTSCTLHLYKRALHSLINLLPICRQNAVAVNKE